MNGTVGILYMSHLVYSKQNYAAFFVPHQKYIIHTVLVVIYMADNKIL